MKHTLREFLKHYNPKKVQILIAEHSVVIDTELEGSLFMIRVFDNEKYYFVSYECELLVLNINEV